MSEILISATEEGRRYMEEIAREMISLFSIRPSEAAGRLNRFWRGQHFTSPDKVNALLHEEPADWARTIYYGPDAHWWLGEDGLGPEPYP